MAVINPYLQVENLTKSFGDLVLFENLSFGIAEGQRIGLVAKNGSGKTTTMNCILALLKYNEGEIKIFGKEMSPSAYDIKSKIGVVFQDVAVFDELTVYGNIDYFCGLYIQDKTVRAEYVEDALKLVGLTENKNQYPKQLSGGLLRRLNIACGIAHKPKLIFLDEPTVAVDPQSRNNILEGIKKLRDGGATIIYTTHYMEEVEILCDRVIILDKGQIIASGTNNELKALAKIEEKVTIEVPELSPSQLSGFESIKNVSEVSYDNGVMKVVFNKGKNNLADMVDYLKDNKIRYNKIFAERPTLNDVFLELTGKELRD